MQKEKLLIHDLANRAGVTVRTIRYYTNEGLLPQPDIHGKFAYYTEDHLRRLELIRRMKEAYLPLREIRLAMSGLSDEEVQNRLAEQSTDPPTRNMVQDSSLVASETGGGALDYIARLLDRQSTMCSPGEHAQGTQPGLNQNSARIPPWNISVEGDIWRRIELAPGVELHIREQNQVPSTRTIQHIRDSVQSLLRNK
jgi:DNA-binding transcriptional MerR regulator